MTCVRFIRTMSHDLSSWPASNAHVWSRLAYIARAALSFKCWILNIKHTQNESADLQNDPHAFSRMAACPPLCTWLKVNPNLGAPPRCCSNNPGLMEQRLKTLWLKPESMLNGDVTRLHWGWVHTRVVWGKWKMSPASLPCRQSANCSNTHTAWLNSRRYRSCKNKEMPQPSMNEKAGSEWHTMHLSPCETGASPTAATRRRKIIKMSERYEQMFKTHLI